MADKIYFDNTWTIDSGAIEHIASDRKMLTDVSNDDGGPLVKISSGNSVAVKGFDRAKLPNGIEICKVLSVPEFNYLPTRSLIGVG
ncbi:hypothetical protein Patl1_05720 [Pistacia atlantica]|uniref:Uncharacterized protein n=1 Tax=Pistacia atlantica TaxID=434234 RepID=A0ACC1BRY7_9ROSI|nr:hypothetical protein Patl1_05720 [Pistacia atlantica]